MTPAGRHSPWSGSNRSTDRSAVVPPTERRTLPPATRTDPSGSSVALWPQRAVASEPAEQLRSHQEPDVLTLRVGSIIIVRVLQQACRGLTDSPFHRRFA